MLRMAVVAAVALSMAGCSTYRIGYRDATVAPGGQTHEVSQNFFLWGLAGGDQVALDRLCSNGVASIDSERSFVDGVLSVITAGLYTPMTVRVQCTSGTSYQLERGPDGEVLVTASKDGLQ